MRCLSSFKQRDLDEVLTFLLRFRVFQCTIAYTKTRVLKKTQKFAKCRCLKSHRLASTFMYDFTVNRYENALYDFVVHIEFNAAVFREERKQIVDVV